LRPYGRLYFASTTTDWNWKLVLESRDIRVSALAPMHRPNCTACPTLVVWKYTSYEIYRISRSGEQHQLIKVAEVNDSRRGTAPTCNYRYGGAQKDAILLWSAETSHEDKLWDVLKINVDCSLRDRWQIEKPDVTALRGRDFAALSLAPD